MHRVSTMTHDPGSSEAARLLYARSRIAQATVILNGLIVAVVFADHASRAATLVWLTLLCALATGRLWDSVRFARRAPAPQEAIGWARRFVVGSALTGISWGAAALVFCPNAPSSHQIFLAFVVGGMCAGAASSNASYPLAFVAYAVPALLPLVVQFLAAGDAIHVAMGGMTALFGIATGLIARSGGRAIAEATRMRLANERDKKQLAYVIDGSTDGYWDWDLRTGTATLSGRYLEILGVRRDRTRGSRAAWEKQLHPDDAERAKAALDAHLAGLKDRYEAEYRLRTASGTWRWVRSRGRVVERDDQGAPLRMAGMLTDVDAAHHAQERRLDEARLSGLVHRVNEIELLVRPDGSIAEMNDRALAAYGYDRKELLGLNVRDLRMPETAGDVSERLAEAAAGEGTRYEAVHRRRDGTPFPVEVSSHALRVGSELYLHALVRDLSEQRAAERSLRESEARLRIALAAADQAEWEYDVRLGVLTVGPGARSITGADGAGLKLRATAWRDLIHPEDRPEAWSQVERCITGRTTSYESEYRLRSASPDGDRWRWARSRGRVTHHDEDGRPLKVMGTIMDVTEIHLLQQKLMEATRLASLGTLAAGVAHEINNPLSWVSSNLSYVIEHLGGGKAPSAGGKDEEELHQVLVEALHGVHRIGAVVKAMRSLGQEREREEAQGVDVRAELMDALKMVGNQLLQRAHVAVKVPDELPPVRAVPGELSRVFLNLLLNGAHAIAAGSPSQNRIAVAGGASADDIVIEIADTGQGMSAEVQARVFEPFFTTKPVGQGTGLGLAIARSIVHSAGGRIEVESEVGRGSTFRVHLPIANPARPQGDAARPPPSGAVAADHSMPLRVLVIDDEPAIRRSLARQLRQACYIDAVASATEALDRIDRGEEWDAVLCDLMMSGMDGIAFCEALQARHPFWLSRVVILTGGAFGDRAERFLAESEVAVVAKPAETPQLLDALARAARRNGCDTMLPRTG
jgi:PAS domain S-box-containing protein